MNGCSNAVLARFPDSSVTDLTRVTSVATI